MPLAALISRVIKLSAFRAEINSRLSARVGGHRFAQNRVVGVLRWQTSRLRLPILSTIRRTVDGQTSIRYHAHLRPNQWQHPNLLRISWMHCNGKSETRRRASRNVRPIIARGIAAIHPAMILLVEQSRNSGSQRKFVHALPAESLRDVSQRFRGR